MEPQYISLVIVCVPAEPTPICYGSRSPAQMRLVEGGFEGHPGLAAKTPESYTNPALARPDKQKIWCKQCFVWRVAEEQARDEKEVAAGQWGSIRDESTIKQACAFFSLVNAP